MQASRFVFAVGFSLCAIASPGCGGGAEGEVSFDAGGPADADIELPAVCRSPVVADVQASAVFSGRVADSGGALAPGADCAAATGNEVVYAVTVAAPSRVIATLVFDETTFEPALYLRSSCTGEPDDDVCGATLDYYLQEARGNVAAGETLYVVVDSAQQQPFGFDGAFTLYIDVAPVLDAGQACDPVTIANVCADGLTCSVAAGGPAVCAPSLGAPTIRSLAGYVSADGHAIRLQLDATDPDGDIARIVGGLFDSRGEPLGPDQQLDEVVEPVPDSTLAGQVDAQVNFSYAAYRLNAFDIVAAGRFEVIDAVGRRSAELTIALSHAPVFHGAGGSCGDGTSFCAGELRCAAGSCVVPASAVAFCADVAGSPAISGSGHHVVSLGADNTDHIEGSCAFEGGNTEAALRLVVPGPESMHLDATILAVAGDDQLDTYLYVRSDCGDPLSELACSDLGQIEVEFDEPSRVQVDLAPGEYTLVVDRSSRFALSDHGDVGVDIALTPIAP